MFAIDVDDEEKLVAVVEVKDKVDNKKVAEKVFRVVSKNHTVLCHAVVVSGPGTVKKTTSGKLKRQATREEYLKGNITKGYLFSDLDIQIRHVVMVTMLIYVLEMLD